MIQAVREKPILMNTEMVQATLAGNKTQTRRIISPQPTLLGNDITWEITTGHSGPGWYGHTTDYPDEGALHYKCPYGQPGDLLYVRETFGEDYTTSVQVRSQTVPTATTVYRADGHKMSDSGTGWKPSIHMPKRAARIWLKVTNVRVERVQDISEEDAAAEGCNNAESEAAKEIGWYEKPRRAFSRLWDSINGTTRLSNGNTSIANSWAANPWVWVVEFEVISTNGRPK